MTDKVKKKLNDYNDILGEKFPLTEVYPADDNEIIKLIDECIYERKPYGELYPTDDDRIY